MKQFYEAIRGKDIISVIAEVKISSPSHGLFGRHSVSDLVTAYESGGADAISVVTEPKRFSGSLALLSEVSHLSSLPVIRKDFLHSITQVSESKRHGASAVLLIANLFEAEQLRKFVEEALTHDLTPVVEVHDEDDLRKIEIISRDSRVVIGVNNRNLQTLEINHTHALSIIDRIDPSRIIIAESAFLEPSQLKLYRGKIDAVLIGTTFLISDNPLITLEAFTHSLFLI